MKKTSFFYYSLMLGLCVSLIFTACKDDDKDSIKPKTELESKSFIVTLLNDSVAGPYLNHTISNDFGEVFPLICTYIVKNKTNGNVDFHIKIEKLQAEPDHYMYYCIGNSCPQDPQKVSTKPDVWIDTEDWAKTFAPGEETNPDGNSYIKMYSGNNPLDAIPGLNKFRITYYNEKDESDYVRFVLTFNFLPIED